MDRPDVKEIGALSQSKSNLLSDERSYQLKIESVRQWVQELLGIYE